MKPRVANRVCPSCNDEFHCDSSRIGRAKKINAPLFCSRKCAGLARRSGLSSVEKKHVKREYDARRREELREQIRAQKREYYQKNRKTLLKQFAEYRKVHMGKHVEYCRTEKYKAYKAEYDKRLRDSEYGEFAECARLLIELEKELRERSTAYQRRVEKGYYLRSAINRRRQLCHLRMNLTPSI